MAWIGGRNVYGAVIIAFIVVFTVFYRCVDLRSWLIPIIPSRLPTTEFSPWPTLDIAKLSEANFSTKPKPPPERRTVLLSPLENFRIQKCMSNKDRDAEKGHGNFWTTSLFGVPVEFIRWKCHDYLSHDSVILEIGGNIGIDAEEFIKRYHSKLVTFEPMLPYAKKLKEIFRQNTDVKVFALGFGNKDSEITVKVTGNNGDASSMFNTITSSAGERLIIRNATELLAQVGLLTASIDLMHINCEGCEFDVLEALVNTKMILNVKNLQFATHPQFSDRIPNLAERYCTLQEILQITHRLHYQFKYTWESWSLR